MKFVDKRRTIVVLALSTVILVLGGTYFALKSPIKFYVDNRQAGMKDIPILILSSIPTNIQNGVLGIYNKTLGSLLDLEVTHTQSSATYTQETLPANSATNTEQATNQSSTLETDTATVTPKITTHADTYYNELVETYINDATPETLKNVLKHFLKFRSEVFPTWNPIYWNKDADYAYGYIQGVDDANKTLTMYIQIPDNRNFSAKADYRVTVTCDENNTIVIASNLDVIKAGVSVWNTVRPQGFNIMSYCLDDECSTMGNACILIDTAANSINKQ